MTGRPQKPKKKASGSGHGSGGGGGSGGHGGGHGDGDSGSSSKKATQQIAGYRGSRLPFLTMFSPVDIDPNALSWENHVVQRDLEEHYIDRPVMKTKMVQISVQQESFAFNSLAVNTTAILKFAVETGRMVWNELLGIRSELVKQLNETRAKAWKKKKAVRARLLKAWKKGKNKTGKKKKRNGKKKGGRFPDVIVRAGALIGVCLRKFHTEVAVAYAPGGLQREKQRKNFLDVGKTYQFKLMVTPGGLFFHLGMALRSISLRDIQINNEWELAAVLLASFLIKGGKGYWGGKCTVPQNLEKRARDAGVTIVSSELLSCSDSENTAGTTRHDDHNKAEFLEGLYYESRPD